MDVSSVRLPRTAALTEKPGAPSLRDQFRANERKLKEAEDKQLEKAKTPEERSALKKAFTEARAERARTFATMVCSEAGDVYKPVPGGNNKGQILKAYYALIGQRAREQAVKDGKPFSQKYVENVKLSRDDVRGLREKLMKEGFSDADFKQAMPLLQKHIARDRFMDRNAMKFMASAEFLTFKAAIDLMLDKVEKDVDAHARQLDEKDHKLLLEHLAETEKRGTRRVTTFTQDVVLTNVDHNKDGNDDVKKTKYTVVGGKLVPLDERQD